MTSTSTATVTTPTDNQILITREFAAPRDLVWRAWTTPELVKRWWSGGHGEVTVAEIDLRVGGTWRYVLVTPEGHEVGFHGEYREIVVGQRIVNTEIFEGAPAGDEEPPLNIVTFEEDDGQTMLSLVVQCASKATRDLILDSGMEEGMQAGYDALEQVALSLR